MQINLKDKYRIVALAAAGLLSITLIAWDQQPGYRAGSVTNQLDTVPAKSEKKSELKDLDKEIEKLNQAIEKLTEKKPEDWEEISKKLQAEISKVNILEVMEKAELAVANIDVDKMNVDLKRALNAVELELKEQRLNESLSELDIDSEEIHRAMSEVKASLKKELADIKKFDVAGLKEAIAELNNAEVMTEVNAELNRVKEMLQDKDGGLKQSIEKAKVELEAARNDLGAYKQMVDSMEKDQLLDTKKDYKIEFRQGVLLINDKKQSEAVTTKYRNYIDYDLTIIKKEKSMQINKKNAPHFD